MGLAISKSIVEMMGGTITVESELGKGSVFSFTAKLQRGEKKEQSLALQEIKWENIRILVVDDDKYILDDFKGIARKFGAFCDTASNGEEALSLFDKNKYNFIFTDWRMPEMNGIELSAELKKRMTDKEEAVLVMMSSNDGSAIISDSKKAGVSMFFQKPLFPSTIEEIVSEYYNTTGEQKKNETKANDDISFAGYRILLAEDVEINREIVLALLEPTELKIDCAINGVQALQMFSNSPGQYDLIFMDLQMPEMDGITATVKIRATGTEKAKTIPIIAMTANVFREDVEKCLAAGMNGHIGKPLDFDEVLETLRKYLGSAN